MVRWSKIITDPTRTVFLSSFAEGKVSGRGILRYLSTDAAARREFNRALRVRGVEDVRELARKAVWRVCNRGNTPMQAIVSCESGDCGSCL